MSKASERENIPLGWIRRWIEGPLETALALLDAIPQRALSDQETARRWTDARQGLRRALGACRELRRLAAWLDSFPHVVVEQDGNQNPNPDVAAGRNRGSNRRFGGRY